MKQQTRHNIDFRWKLHVAPGSANDLDSETKLRIGDITFEADGPKRQLSTEQNTAFPQESNVLERALLETESLLDNAVTDELTRARERTSSAIAELNEESTAVPVVAAGVGISAVGSVWLASEGNYEAAVPSGVLSAVLLYGLLRHKIKRHGQKTQDTKDVMEKIKNQLEPVAEKRGLLRGYFASLAPTNEEQQS